MKAEVDSKYSKLKSLILYCDKANSELSANERIQIGKVNIKLDYEELVDLHKDGQKHTSNIENA